MQEVGGAGGRAMGRQGGGKAVTALRHGAHGGLELGGEIQGHVQRLQAGGGQRVGQLQGGELRDQGRITHQVAEAPGGGSQGLAEGAQQHQVRVAVHGQAMGGRCELGIGLIQYHQGWIWTGCGRGEQGL